MRTGYYGRYAKCRKIPVNDAYERVKNGEAFTLRLKSPGDFNKKIIDKNASSLYNQRCESMSIRKLILITAVDLSTAFFLLKLLFCSII